MPLTIRTLFPPAVFEAGSRAAVDQMIAILMEVLASLRAEQTLIEPEVRSASINDVSLQIAELRAFKAAQAGDSKQSGVSR